MMKYVKNQCITFCIIYTLVSMVNMLMNESMNHKMFFLVCGVSFFATISSYILVEKDEYSNQRVLMNQLGYVGMLIIMTLLTMYLAGYMITPLTIIVNIVSIVSIFIIVKYFIYQRDQRDIKIINMKLEELQ